MTGKATDATKNEFATYMRHLKEKIIVIIQKQMWVENIK